MERRKREVRNRNTFTPAWGPFLLMSLLAPAVSGAEEQARPALMSVSTSFPGGSAEIRSIDPAAGEIHLQPALHEGRGWPCWWFVRLDGMTPGQRVRLKVSANPRPFRDQSRLAASWSQPDRAAISTDNLTWSQTPPGRKVDGTALYEFEAPAERVWLAWGPPFLPGQTDELLSRIEEQLPEAERFVLARTLGDRPVRGIRIGGGSEDQPARLAVWAHARQHAWESGSSWVARGFLEWVAGDDPAAVELRRTATVYVVPIMDVDNAAIGAGGKEAVPRDHNRDWSGKPVYPEVAAAQKRIRELDASGELRVFLDLHNPGAGSRRPFYFGPAKLKEFPSEQQDRYARWLAYSIEMIRGPLAIEPEYKFATYVKTDEERLRMSKEWVHENTSGEVISLCLETAWNAPESTQEGYMTVGAQLGETLARYLSSLEEQK